MQYRINSEGKAERRKLQQRSMIKIFEIKFAATLWVLVLRAGKRPTDNSNESIKVYLYEIGL
jgi:hypothetical protein